MSQRAIKKEVSTADYTLWVSTEGGWQELASNKYYDQPTQVMFRERQDSEVYTLGGIAYQDYIICLDCGGVIPLSDIDYSLGFKELSWISVSDEMLGDEKFENSLDEPAQNEDSNSQEIADNIIYVKASFVIQSSHRDMLYSNSNVYQFPSYYNDYMIDKAIQEYYLDWAKEYYKDIIPESALERFEEIYEQFGIPQNDYSWVTITAEQYHNYKKN